MEAAATGAPRASMEVAITADMDEQLCFLEEYLAVLFDRVTELEGRIGE